MSYASLLETIKEGMLNAPGERCDIGQHRPGCLRHISRCEENLHIALDIIDWPLGDQWEWREVRRISPNRYTWQYFDWAKEYLSDELCTGEGKQGTLFKRTSGKSIIACPDCSRYLRIPRRWHNQSIRRHWRLKTKDE